MTIRAIHIIQKLAPGGIELLVMRLCAANPAHTRVYVLEGAPEAGTAGVALAQRYGVEPVYFGKSNGWDLSVVGKLRRALKRDKPAAVFTHHIGPLLYGGLAARLVRVPHIMQVEHDAWHLRDGRQLFLTKAAFQLLRPIVTAVSLPVAKEVERLTGKKKVYVIPNGVDMTVFCPGDKRAAREKFGLPERSRLIGGVGRLERVKGFDVLLDAISHLPESFHLALAGDGTEREALEAQAAALGISHRVTFLGNVVEVNALMPAFDVLAVPSREEGLPLTVIEAQAANVPVVATRVGALPDAVCPEASQVVPPEDESALATALLIQSEAPQTDAPVKFVRRRFDWRDTLSAYDSLAQGVPL
ncbi:glycosyltransferase [Pseudovibrio sp. SPO723]|uniref:glycosyltransferase n=1 Tax=Nesiotobacter zosterae TaxID=392721 RepID=UPI0029C360B1|nr:glycosyltransferase [Pseudovibrio sp. SPO723]MDX5595226.1 glycosyltransferase [Pseudovibrio sp. SPO723]